MKNLMTITKCVLFSILLISCGGDSEDEELKSSLNGDWTATSFTMDITQNTSVAGNDVDVVINGSGSEFNYDLTLDDGTFSTTGNYQLDYSFMTMGQTTQLSQLIDDIDGEGTYTIDGNEMTIDGQFYSYEVDGLSAAGSPTESSTATFELDGDVLTFSQNQTYETNTSGVSVSTKIISKSTWMRK